MEETKILVKVSIQEFCNKGIIEELNYDYIGMEEAFFNALCITCIENYDENMREELYNKGLFMELVDYITNARYAYNLVHTISDKVFSINNSIDNFLNKLIDKIPEMDNLNEIIGNLPDEFKEVFSQYRSIIDKGE